MDYKKLAEKFIKEGKWTGVAAIAVRFFAKWLAEAAKSEQPEGARAPIIALCQCELCREARRTA